MAGEEYFRKIDPGLWPPYLWESSQLLPQGERPIGNPRGIDFYATATVPISTAGLPVTTSIAARSDDSSGEEAIQYSGEIFVMGDHQIGFLNGRRTFFQSNTVDSFVSPAVRPIALDLFSFTVAQAHLSQQKKRIEENPHFYIQFNVGDFADNGCNSSVRTAFRAAGFSPNPNDPNYIPFLATPGNHECTSIGNFTSGMNAFGIVGVALGLEGPQKSYMNDYWAPMCGGEGNTSTKDVFVKQLIQIYGANFNDVVTELDWGCPKRFKLADTKNSHRWGTKRSTPRETEFTYNTFWKDTADPKRKVAVVHLDKGGDNPLREWAIFSAYEMPDGTHVIATDSMDQLKTNAVVPGLIGRFSYIQARVIEAYMDTVMAENPEARFIIGSHFPLNDIYNPPLGSRSKWTHSMRDVFDRPNVDYFFSGHKHERIRRDVADESNRGDSKLRRRTPLYDDTVPSTTDWPNEAYSLRWYEKDGKRVYEAEYHTLDLPAMGITDRVREQYQLHEGYLAEYRNQTEKIKDKKIRKAAEGSYSFRKLSKALDVINRPGSVKNEVLMFDTLQLMEFQFKEVFTGYKSPAHRGGKNIPGQLESLVEVMESEIEGLRASGNQDSADKLERIKHRIEQEIDHAKTRLVEWNSQMDQPRSILGEELSIRQAIKEYKKRYIDNRDYSEERASQQKAFGEEIFKLLTQEGIMGHDERSNRDMSLMDLFVIPCADSTYCVESIQNMLMDIPEETKSWQSMLLMALGAAEADHQVAQTQHQHVVDV